MRDMEDPIAVAKLLKASTGHADHFIFHATADGRDPMVVKAMMEFAKVLHARRWDYG